MRVMFARVCVLSLCTIAGDLNLNPFATHSLANMITSTCTLTHLELAHRFADDEVVLCALEQNFSLLSGEVFAGESHTNTVCLARHTCMHRICCRRANAGTTGRRATAQSRADVAGGSHVARRDCRRNGAA
jgi:hypothetical protein